ncbi:MAG: hypothetical protein RSD36_16240 [Terrisporobacter sp.]
MCKITMEMDELKNIVNGVIKNEFIALSDNNYEELKSLEGNKYSKLEKKTIELHNIIKNALPEKYIHVLGEYIDAELDIKLLEIRYYYDKGVKHGVNKLSFLKDTKIIDHM